MEQVRKSEQEKQEDADDTEEPDIKWRILQILLGILLPAVPAAVFLAGGMELVIRLKWGILAAWGILLAGIFAVGKETGGKKGEDEEGERRGLGDHVPGGRGAGAGRNPGSGYSGAAKHFFRKNGIRNDRGSQNRGKDRAEKDADEMHTVLLTGRQIYPVTRRLVPERTEAKMFRSDIFPFDREEPGNLGPLPESSPDQQDPCEDRGSGDGYIITDLNSTNGTSVNGHFLETNESMTISPGISYLFGSEISFLIENGQAYIEPSWILPVRNGKHRKNPVIVRRYGVPVYCNSEKIKQGGVFLTFGL